MLAGLVLQLSLSTNVRHLYIKVYELILASPEGY